MKNTFYLHLRTRPLNNYILGKKQLEARIAKQPYDKIAVGDTLVFNNDEDTNDKRIVEAQVSEVYRFPTFKEAFDTLDPTEAIPGLTKQGVIEVYHTLYSNQAINQYGVVFFRLEVKRVQA